MEKVLAIVVLIMFVWLAIPRVTQGEWIAPTAIDPGSWVTHQTYTANYESNQLAQADSAPSQGFGWFHFDFWNDDNYRAPGIPATTADLDFRSPSTEFRD